MAVIYAHIARRHYKIQVNKYLTISRLLNLHSLRVYMHNIIMTTFSAKLHSLCGRERPLIMINARVVLSNLRRKCQSARKRVLGNRNKYTSKFSVHSFDSLTFERSCEWGDTGCGEWDYWGKKNWEVGLLG